MAMPQERKPFSCYAKPPTTSLPIGRRNRVKRAILQSLLRMLASLCSRARRLLSSFINSVLHDRINPKLLTTAPAMDMQMVLDILAADQAPHLRLLLSRIADPKTPIV